MKKIAAFFLCTLMVMSLSLPAFALTPDATGTEPVSPHSVSHTHSGFPYSATCNGTTQTWYCKCSCGAYFTQTRTCPAGPHSPHHCEALPI